LKVLGLNGKEYVWNLTGYDVFNNDSKKRSKYHVRARAIIKDIFNSYRILEEVKLPGSTQAHRKSVLYLDFYLPTISLGVEVHGQQHYEFCGFFHKNKADFIKSQVRDEDKASWCQLNGITLITLKYSESDDEWRERLKSL
jgi:hypothetical protein